MSTFLHGQRPSFYTRVVIPKGLRIYFRGRREVWKSLKTMDKDEASCRSSQWVALGKRLFFTLRRQGRHMTKAQIEALVSNWLEAAFDEAEDDRATHGYISESVRENAYNGLSALFDGASEDLTSGDYRRVAVEADELLQAANFPALDHASPDFARLCRRLLRAKIEYARVEADRWEGEYEDHRPGSLQQVGKAPFQEEVEPSLPLTVVLEKYLIANPRPPRTADPLKAEFRRFVELLGGDKPIATITRADCVRYKESLQVDRKLSLLTCLKHISNLDMLLKWASTHDYLPDGLQSPARGLAPSKRQAKKQSLKRRPFSPEELIRVFGSQGFRSQKAEAPERYWLVLFLLFQGCRREEGAQLYLKDFLELEGMHVINITDDEPDQTLKYPEKNRRKVPLHSGLIKLGFLQYAQSMRKAGQQRLFPQLTHKGKNGYGNPVGTWFGRLLDSVDLSDPKLVIHSFRRGMITALHSAGVPVNIAEVITGHSPGTVHADYVDRTLISMKTLQDAIEKVQFPEVVKLLFTRL